MYNTHTFNGISLIVVLKSLGSFGANICSPLGSTKFGHALLASIYC